MKYITLIIGLLVVGCGKQEQTDANESTPSTNTNKVDGTTAKPVKELTLEEKKVVGTYEAKRVGDTYRVVLLENGIAEAYRSGKKEEKEVKWSISKEGELHFTYGGGVIVVLSINKDESLTGIASIDKDGKREDFLKEDQQFVPTLKKIK